MSWATDDFRKEIPEIWWICKFVESGTSAGVEGSSRKAILEYDDR